VILITMSSRDNLETFKAITDDAIKDGPLYSNQSKAADILSEAHKHLTRKEFLELERYVFDRLET